MTDPTSRQKKAQDSGTMTVESGHEPQKGLETKTDGLTDRQS
jgi:hypothetical protein